MGLTHRAALCAAIASEFAPTREWRQGKSGSDFSRDGRSIHHAAEDLVDHLVGDVDEDGILAGLAPFVAFVAG